MKEFLNKVIDIGSSYGGKIVLAIVVTVVGLLLIKTIGKAVNRALEKTNFDKLVKIVLGKIAKFLLYVFLLIGIIEIIGVPMTSVVALLASAGLAVGLAFQGALSNLAGGFMILIFRPFKIGDYIESTGAEGFVNDISIFYTKIMTLDNKLILVPNGDLMSSNVTNFTANEKRRIDQDFKITNDIDQNFVKEVLMHAATNTAGVCDDPAPFARLSAVDDDTYIFTVRVWCQTEKYWDVYFDLIENCAGELRDHGIDDPEERIAVRLVSEDKDGAESNT
ncbi:MAG: mechanosensitive ion channel [Oscillospiraceae bacterium]|nr:mechanosensitive ion channel [Oscillospiraceae bacterium]